MTALILGATPLLEAVVSKMHALGLGLVRALDAFAQARVRNAVPEWQLRKAQREIDRYRQLMHADRKVAVPDGALKSNCNACRHLSFAIEGAKIEQALDLSGAQAYDCALDILRAYKLTDNFHVNLEIVLKDIGALAEVTFEVEPKSWLRFHSDCRHVVFRCNANVGVHRFAEIMRSIKKRIGFDAGQTWWQIQANIATKWPKTA